MFKDELNMCSLIFSRAVRTIKPTASRGPYET